MSKTPQRNRRGEKGEEKKKGGREARGRRKKEEGRKGGGGQMEKDPKKHISQRMILMMASASPSWLCIRPYCSENVYIEQLMHSQDGGHILLSSIVQEALCCYTIGSQYSQEAGTRGQNYFTEMNNTFDLTI